MANSRYEYVKGFEQPDALLPQCWVVVRIDGKGFTKFCEKHRFKKPNDERALRLMNAAAKEVMEQFGDVVIAYGHSDEFSFVLKRDTSLYQRRASKICSVFVSLFTSAYVMQWAAHLPDVPLAQPPCFDARAVLYPSDRVLRDYLAWRQADCHVNNQYNQCFWALVHRGATPEEAQARLKGTQTAEKNELLFTVAGVNYNDLPELDRKGSVLYRKTVPPAEQGAGGEGPGTAEQRAKRARRKVVVEHIDIIGEQFWRSNPQVLGRGDGSCGGAGGPGGGGAGGAAGSGGDGAAGGGSR